MSTTQRVLVVADDLTGANATAAGFARAGLRSVTVGAHAPAGALAEVAARFGVVVASTDGRHAPPEVAAPAARATVRASWPVDLVCNRIDSTLRGNVGPTTAAILDEVGTESGDRAVALCAPAHPDAKRYTIDGYQLLDGARLEDTELATDAHNPITHSNVAKTLTDQTELNVANVPLSIVTAGASALEQHLATVLADPVNVVIADALTTDHLDRIASAAVRAAPQGLRWVSVDPGPASVALAKALQLDHGAAGGPLLAVSGSATRLTRTQLKQLASARDAAVLLVTFTDGAIDVDRTSSALDRALTNARAGDVVILATAVSDGDVVTLTPPQSNTLPSKLAKAVRRALESHAVDGLYLTGGDVSAAAFAELGASGLHIETEVAPLAVAGTFVGGPWAGLPVVTKGGMVGDAHTAIACIDHIRKAADAARRHAYVAQSRLPL